MRILLTNDDGVFAPGLAAMYEKLKALGDLTVVAPDGERSSVGQAITLGRPLYHKVVSVGGKFKAHALSGTPTDCVKFALAVLLKKRPTLIVSGINHGGNDGCSVFYSGTVGAAREGALMGVPSVAISLDTIGDADFTTAAKIGVKLIRWAVKSKMPAGTFFNINVPDLPEAKIKGVKLAEQCRIPIHSQFSRKKEIAGRFSYWLTGRPLATRAEAQSDSYALQNGFVTVVPIHCDATDHGFFGVLRKDLKPPYDQI